MRAESSHEIGKSFPRIFIPERYTAGMGISAIKVNRGLMLSMTATEPAEIKVAAMAIAS